MINKVRVVRFKRFADHTFDLSGGAVLLAGPNNGGKSTLLHAISCWNLALKRWKSDRGDSQANKKRISLVLDEFNALPLREMNLLWLNRHTARRNEAQKQPKPAPIYIQVFANKGRRVEESLTIEFLYANEKLIYVRPVESPDNPQPIAKLPSFAADINIVHVPATSGIVAQEQRHSIGMQAKLVGEGRPGEIVRNLLLEIWEQSKKSELQPPWKFLHDDIAALFQCDLLPPEFSDARPYILCEYRPNPNPQEEGSRSPKIDVANAGSGFHQVLLLLAFFYSRQASVLLLDEPDAHLHFILQREIFDHLRTVAQRRDCKLIVATHSEVLLNGTEPEQIVSFVGQNPRRLVTPQERQRLQDALRRLSSLDFVQADHVRAVLYVEDESDHKLLREWAKVLNHSASKFLEFPYLVPLRGKGNLDDAKGHFQCLQMAKPLIRGVCILDSDDDKLLTPPAPEGLTIRLWPRREIENYLINPVLLKRFAHRDQDLFSQGDDAIIDAEFAANFPFNFDPLGDIRAIKDLKGSNFLEKLLAKTSSPLAKRELFILAGLMTRAEIHPDVHNMLDAIAAILPGTIPSIQVNTAPPDEHGEAGGEMLDSDPNSVGE